jgi:hypothetical protein
MIKTMTEYDFTQAFKGSDSREDQFSHSALKAMYEYYEQLEEDCDTQIEFDMIALCCEWTEYTSALEAALEYGFGTVVDDESLEEKALEWLQEQTQVIEFGDKGVLVAQF